MSNGLARKSPDSILWQDYRAANTGMIVFYASDPVSEMPVREIPEELKSSIVPDPHYETGTYGFYGCARTKIRGAFFKSKIRYLFFLTKYAGAKEGYKDKLLITGYYRINKTADVQKLHLRSLEEYSCIDFLSCIALRADTVYFVDLADAFEVSADQLKAWGYNAKVSKQLRIILNEENTGQLLSSLNAKENHVKAYIAETKRLEPYDETREAVGEVEEEEPALPEEPKQSEPTAETHVEEKPFDRSQTAPQPAPLSPAEELSPDQSVIGPQQVSLPSAEKLPLEQSGIDLQQASQPPVEEPPPDQNNTAGEPSDTGGK